MPKTDSVSMPHHKTESVSMPDDKTDSVSKTESVQDRPRGPTGNRSFHGGTVEEASIRAYIGDNDTD